MNCEESNIPPVPPYVREHTQNLCRACDDIRFERSVTTSAAATRD
jgi:hypothetical protein